MQGDKSRRSYLPGASGGRSRWVVIVFSSAGMHYSSTVVEGEDSSGKGDSNPGRRRLSGRHQLTTTLSCSGSKKCGMQDCRFTHQILQKARSFSFSR
jgi:hypothetical protein